MLKGWLGKWHQYQSKRISGCTVRTQRNKKTGYQFIDTIDIPDEISKIKIGSLSLYGKITKEGIERIKRLLPDTDIKINSSREVIKLH